MRVVKILNNNALLAVSAEGTEYVYLASGIGFANKAGQSLCPKEGQKRYKLTSAEQEQLASTGVEAIYLELSAAILSLAQEKFPDADSNILLPLADHIAFAIARIRNQVEIVNPFVQDICLLFPEEYAIATKGAALITAKTGVGINADEISYIALHIHSAITAEHVQMSLQVVEGIKTFVREMEEDYHIVIRYDSIAYTRLVTHIKFMIARIHSGEMLGVDMNDYTKENFVFAYEKALCLMQTLEQITKAKFQKNEIGYLALHIERVIQATLTGENA
ncbi:MAG: PRD domain-containing protein [Faecalibacterium sp.]